LVHFFGKRRPFIASVGFAQKKRFPADALFGRFMMEDRGMQVPSVLGVRRSVIASFVPYKGSHEL
jgi:hypothetical protein